MKKSYYESLAGLMSPESCRDLSHCVAEVDSSGNPLKSYTWGPGIDNLLAITTYGTETNTYYALTDHLGTVTALADETGAVVESYEYDAWGNVLGVYDENDQQISTSGIGNRFTFQGREYSWATGLYNFRARWYDPVTGRWLSKDPIGIEGGLNQYVFCENNPVMFVDPWGLDIYYGGSGHSVLIIDDPKSATGRVSYDFGPQVGRRGNITKNVIYGPSITNLSEHRGDVPASYIRIPTSPVQDGKAKQIACSAEDADMPYCVVFNNCAHMARMILDGAGVPVGNVLIDDPDKLRSDVEEIITKHEGGM